MDNIYYSPQKFGLEVVAETELSEPNYSFDTVVVWKDKEGKFYWAHDEGCSCPVPFEDYISVSHLNKLNDFDKFKNEIKSLMHGFRNKYYPNYTPIVNEFFVKVRQIINK